MKIPRKIANRWKLLYDRGDIVQIAEQNDIDPRTVSKGIKGECNEQVFAAISKFYNEKEQLLKTV